MVYYACLTITIHMQNQPFPVKHWYHSGWKVALVGLGALVVASILGFGGLTFYYWREIKAGRGATLTQKIYGEFSASGSNTGPAFVKRTEIETTDDPFLGNANAEIVIVEFVDFKCPNCKTALPIMKRVLAKYGQKIKLIVRDFPVESLHPGANKMAELAGCAYNQGLFWPVHDWLYTNQDSLPENISANDLKEVAGLTGLDYKKLTDCFNNQTMVTEINRDYADGFKLGVNGTPTFFVNGEKIEGVVPWEAWEAFFSKLSK